MQAFIKHCGITVALDRANVDTDQIIPKQFLKRIERSGFGKFLFFDWRFNDDSTDNTEFELNQPAVKEATVLLTKRNFGS
ncbi:MAG: 3-isopropylmalate dehydratase small subunit, partial [Planctomycetaceae bacterium]|nr:3-isopropylmalate dehydratase small subunit [Planctomycetaceae bacterium]